MSTRVVTLPSGASSRAFARRAKSLGAELLEVRDDLTAKVEAQTLLPLMRTHRGADEHSETPAGRMASAHFDRPLSPQEAEAHWASCTAPFIKHVEPLGPPASGGRLLETQRRLIGRFGEGRVTVLATGECALPWRAVLAQKNAFDFLAVDAESASAKGQRLLADAVRADAATGPRLAIIGHRIAHARSPRVHPQPFDRWDLPPDAPVRELVEALRPHYRGFAITTPFKRAFGGEAAVNTLVRRADGWATYNTDVDGARAVVQRHGARDFTVLGDGGAAWALRKAGARAVVRAAEAGRIGGDVFWTWPAHLPPPPALRLEGARVFVIAYGAPASTIAAHIRESGGTPVRAGHTWFVAQARAQRRLWLEAT